ncbi:MAG: 2-C-methyl-D-erythritol 2,4-cyclodiphosphate synthase [Candidatus Omnitrophica bacterium]|nr:2-C-methyl-D-erythritol 2,4-cyclodiphosphate synthase [Candidatus Omnitrophota bacterium]
MKVRIGYGFDLHRWAENRRLVLGGVEIPHEMGLLGHSDADALTHAVIDALLGALAMGDIGQHFPDTDPRFKDADSIELLKTTMILIRDAGYRVGNVDCTIVADAPKMAPHIRRIRRTLAEPLGASEDQVSVKATRTEGVIFQPEDGLLAMACVLLEG